MTDSSIPSVIHVGFLTVFAEGPGYLGGYLVTNSWGRPVEFRLSSAVQPNRTQQILYGKTLTEYLCADLIGKTLVEKTATAATLIVTDSVNALPLRSRLETPVVGVVADEAMGPADPERPIVTLSHTRSSVPIRLDGRWADDESTILAILDRLDSALDLAEPFTRIREAMGEARKLGVTNRAA